MKMNRYTQNGCTLSDHWSYNGMQVVWLENELIKVGVLIGRGADIFEFRYKPRDVNYLLRLPGEIKNPQTIFAQRRDTGNQMEDFYYGGWQDCIPNSAPFVYKGASYGQHGEAWGIPWKYSIMENSTQIVSVKCWVRPMRTPLLVEKTITLKIGDPAIYMHSKVTNEGASSFDFIWGQHIAFGLPFLQEGGKIHTNATTIASEPSMPEKRRFKPGIETKWPEAQTPDGQLDDASIIPPADQGSFSELSFLSGFQKKGFYHLTTPSEDFGIGLEWDAELFKYVWYWQERYGMEGAPWWGKVFSVALEPWTARFTSDPLQGIANGEWELLEGGASIQTEIKAFSIDKTLK